MRPLVIASRVGPVAAAEYAARLDPLGPFGAAPILALAVSGGPDSMALALLTARWSAARGGSVLALVVDHGLRPESGDEAALTLRRLAELGVPGRLLQLHGLRCGPAMAERAREARYAVLVGACRAAGIAHLLLGHHAGDQAETVMMRRLSRSGGAGLAGMAAISELESVRLLRPLLAVPAGRLRAALREAGIGWIEDPSNRNPAALRARLRAERSDPEGDQAGTRGLVETAFRHGVARGELDRAVAATLAARASLYPEGFAVLSPGPILAPALAALLQAVAGSRYPPSLRQVAPLAAAPAPATLGGVRLLPAGRMGPGLLLVREEAAQARPVPARPGARWDGRFRLGENATPRAAAMLGALGSAAAGLRKHSHLPSAVLRSLPALRVADQLLAVPHLGYPDAAACRDWPLTFCPRRPAAGAPWPAGGLPAMPSVPGDHPSCGARALVPWVGDWGDFGD